MNQLGNLEKLGILVIVILVVVVGVVAITPKASVDTALFPDEPAVEGEPLDPAKDASGEIVSPDGVTKPGEPGVVDPANWPLPGGQLPLGTGDVPSPTPLVGGEKPGVNPIAPAPLPVEPKIAEYKVQKGDTGASIAKKLLGKATAWGDIVAVNPGLDARRLKINQVIKVPAAATAKTDIVQPPVPTPTDKNLAGKPGVVPPTPAPYVIQPEPAPAEARKYTVQPGDTLSDIARRELGSASKWRQILEVNPGMSEAIRPGMTLNLPSKSALAVKSAPSPKASPAPTVGGKSYKVQRGDTLTSIASRMLGSSGRWREIVAANEPVLHGSDKINVGMDLVIPGGTEAR